MFSLPKIVALTAGAGAALVLGTIGFYEGRKAYWDRQVLAMCKKDGGVTVIEQIEVSPEELGTLGKVDGNPAIAPEPLAKKDEPAFTIDTETVLRDWAPRVTRWERTVKRRSDSATIGKIIFYSRIGGDLPTGIIEGSAFNCPGLTALYAAQKTLFSVKKASRSND